MPNHVSVIGSAKFPALQKKNDDVSPLFLFFGLSGQSAIIICDSRIELRVLKSFFILFRTIWQRIAVEFAMRFV